MRLYRNTAASRLRLDYGLELIAGLGYFDKTKPLVATFQPVQDALEAALRAREDADRAVLPQRAARRFAEYRCESMLRTLDADCRRVDDGREGPVSRAVFPNGLTVEVVPKGQGQVDAAQKLRKRVVDSGVAELQPHRDTLLSQIDAALAPLAEAARALSDALSKANDAFTTELARRDDHRRTVDAIFGHLRSLFPGDRAIQDVIAPEVDAEPKKADDVPTPVQ